MYAHTLDACLCCGQFNGAQQVAWINRAAELRVVELLVDFPQPAALERPMSQAFAT
jgi:hypothetical protein